MATSRSSAAAERPSQCPSCRLWRKPSNRHSTQMSAWGRGWPSASTCLRLAFRSECTLLKTRLSPESKERLGYCMYTAVHLWQCELCSMTKPCNHKSFYLFILNINTLMGEKEDGLPLGKILWCEYLLLWIMLCPLTTLLMTNQSLLMLRWCSLSYRCGSRTGGQSFVKDSVVPHFPESRVGKKRRSTAKQDKRRQGPRTNTTLSPNLALTACLLLHLLIWKKAGMFTLILPS